MRGRGGGARGWGCGCVRGLSTSASVAFKNVTAVAGCSAAGCLQGSSAGKLARAQFLQRWQIVMVALVADSVLHWGNSCAMPGELYSGVRRTHTHTSSAPDKYQHFK